jgi:hypothetical protein
LSLIISFDSRLRIPVAVQNETNIVCCESSIEYAFYLQAHLLSDTNRTIAK